MSAPDIDAGIMEAALEWFVIMSSGVTTAGEGAAFAQWRASHTDHERAWRRLEDMSRIMRAGRRHPVAVRETLLGADRRLRSRRRMLKVLAFTGMAVVPVAWLAREREPLCSLLADYRTSAHEQRALTLADGTRLWLNISTAADVRFTDTERRVNLFRGEIEVASAADSVGRPFLVTTEDGVLRPVGTRFTVRRLDDEESTRLHVSEGAVEVRIANPDVAPTLVDAGRQLRFSAEEIYGPAFFSSAPNAWVDGMLSAERMPLGEFIRELSRYRGGLLRCDPAVAHLHLTGTYPLKDTDLILGKLEQTLPVRVTYRTPYWVTVTAR